MNEVHVGKRIAGIAAGTCLAAVAVLVAVPGCSSESPVVDVPDTGIDAGNDGTVVACAAPAIVCGASCVDVKYDPGNCGACGKACTSDQVCSAGACASTCGTGTTKCGQSCVDTANDANNCGGCGTKCGAGELCTQGKCALTCQQGKGKCTPDGGVPYCADFASDNVNCGACGNTCPQGTACNAGKCSTTCGAPQSLCSPDGGSPYCANLANDPNNCGACGTSCPQGQVCTSGDGGLGVCALNCFGGSTKCGNLCVDLQNDPNNCFSCGNVCPGGAKAYCKAGVCGTTGIIGTGTTQDPYRYPQPLASCKAYLASASNAPSGYYSVSPNGNTTTVYCDQVTKGGGWTRCFDFTNTAQEDIANNSFLDTCVDYNNASWMGGEVLIHLRDVNQATVYAGFGTRTGPWTYDQLTSTAAAGSQYSTGAHNRVVTLDTGDKLVITGRSANNAGCQGALGNGYGIELYPAALVTGSVKMLVMPFKSYVPAGTRAFWQGNTGWVAQHEITYNGGTAFDTCGPVVTGTLGSFSMLVR